MAAGASAAPAGPTFFGLVCSGQIESAYVRFLAAAAKAALAPPMQFPEFDSLYCKFGFHMGPDWTVLSVGPSSRCAVASCRLANARAPATELTWAASTQQQKGLEEGITQFAKSRQASTFTDSGQAIKPCVWNFPFSVSFKSTNPFGVPLWRTQRRRHVDLTARLQDGHSCS
nr:B9 domain-containing protein 1 [Polyrhizophydium stewartii]